MNHLKGFKNLIKSSNYHQFLYKIFLIYPNYLNINDTCLSIYFKLIDLNNFSFRKI
jgi:hypothetical protein